MYWLSTRPRALISFQDRETLGISTLIKVLAPITISPQPKRRLWILDTFVIFRCRSSFSYFTNNPIGHSMPVAKEFWKVLVPTKVKLFAWRANHQKLNTNNLLQICHPVCALSLDICVLCFREGETHAQMFL